MMKNCSLTILDKTYKSWLKDIKTYISSQQIKAAVKVNTELLKVYWRLGRDITTLKADAQWGFHILALSAEQSSITTYNKIVFNK